MTYPMPGPPEWYDIDWEPILGMVWIKYEGECDQTFHHEEIDAKRLTDSECSAQYWEAYLAYRENYLMGTIERLKSYIWEMGMKFLSSQYPYPRPPQFNEDTFRSVALKEFKTWYRFATLPHALEQDTK